MTAINIQQSNDNSWIAIKKHLYLLSILLPAVPVLSAFIAVKSGNGIWLWFSIIFFYFILPLGDHVFGEDNANPDEEQVQTLKTERYYAYILYLATMTHWLAFIAMAYVVSHYEWSWINILGASLSTGLLNGLALVAGHEMGHKVRDRVQVTCSKIILACSGYGHFCIEHNKGHHKDVATPEDPASSKFGESIYKFVKREIPGAFRRAWSLESERLKRLNKSEWSFSNEIIQSALITVVAYVLMLAYFGAVMIPFLAIAAAFGWWQLTCANYVEHYGLLRLKNSKGRYERCQPHHSWNSNHKLSNLVLLHLQRHSDHHAFPTRPYQVLRDYDDVPSLPSGYPWMFVLAMIPPIWYSIMDPKVIAWSGGDMNKVNIDTDKSDIIFQLYHNPVSTQDMNDNQDKPQNGK